MLSSTSQATAIKSKIFNRDLTIEQADILLSYLTKIAVTELPEQGRLLLHEERQQLALALFIAYRDGDGVVADEAVSEAYLASYLLCAKPPGNNFDDILFWCSWFTTIRLATLRIDREVSLIPGSFDHAAPAYKQFSKALQFSYGLEIIVGIAKLFYYSFRPETVGDKNEGIPWYIRLRERFDWKRFNSIRNSTQFNDFMSNAVVWFVVNGLSLLLTAWLTTLGFSPWILVVIPSSIQLFGFGYDFIHDRDYVTAELEKYKSCDELFINTEPGEDSSESELINLLRGKRDQQIRITSEKRDRVKKIAIIIFIGMALLYLLPLASPFIAGHLPWLWLTNLLISYDKGQQLVDIMTELFKTLGSSIVVAGGFIYGGLIGRVWRLESWKQSASWLLNFVRENVAELSIASSVLLCSFTFPTIATFVAACGGPTIVCITSFLVLKGIRAIGNRVWEWYSPTPLPDLTATECHRLRTILLTLENLQITDLIQNLRNLSEEDQSVLKKAAGLSDIEWLRHVRNWSLVSETKRERSLIYRSLSELCTTVKGRVSLTIISSSSPPVPPLSGYESGTTVQASNNGGSAILLDPLLSITPDERGTSQGVTYSSIKKISRPRSLSEGSTTSMQAESKEGYGKTASSYDKRPPELSPSREDDSGSRTCKTDVLARPTFQTNQMFFYHDKSSIVGHSEPNLRRCQSVGNLNHRAS